MKTTKFLTILFALILGAAIDATAQSSTPTTATPLGDNKWSFTMPAGNVKLNATFLLTTDKIAALINTTKDYDGTPWATAKSEKYYPTTSASLNGDTYLTYTNEDNETVYIKLTAKYMESDGVTAATNAGTASSILVTLDGVYVKGDDNQMTKQDNYEFAGTETYALNDGKFSIPDASIDYYDLSSLLTWDKVKDDITCVKPYDGTSVAEVKNDGQYEVTTSFGTNLYIVANANFTKTKEGTTATVSNVGTGYGIRIEFKLEDGQDSYTLGTSNGARQTSLTKDYAPTDGVVAKINPIDISSYMAYTDWVGDMGANIISTKAHDGTAAAEIINSTKTIVGETINSVQETVTLTVSDAYFMNGAAQTSEVGNGYDIQYKISVPSDGHYCIGFDDAGAPKYSVTETLSGANIRAAYDMTLSIADYDYGSPSVPEVKNGTDVIPTTTIAASGSPYKFNVKSGDSWLEYPVAYDQLQIDYLKTSEAGDYTLKVIYDDGISYGEAICDFTVSLATPNPTVVAKNDLTYISKNTSQELVDFNSVSYPYTVLFSLTGEDGSYSAVIPTGIKASTYTVYYKVDAVQDKYAALAAQTVDVTIAKKQLDLTVTGDAITKDYDGTTDADVSGLTVTLPTTIAAGEDVSIDNDNVTGEFPDAAAGSYTIANNKPVTIGVTLTGADAQNYEVNDAQYNGTINVKTISIPLGLGADYTFSFPKEDLTFTPATSAVGKVACVYDAADSKYHITTVTSGITAGDYILTSNNNSLEVQVKIDNGLISKFFDGTTWRKYIRFVAPTAYTSSGESFARLGMARTATGTANITTYDSPFPATAKLYINDAEVGDAGYEIETAGTSTITYTLKDDNGIIHSTSNTVKLDNVAPDTPATITYTDENGAEHTINGYETEDKAKTAANYVKIPKGTTISYHPTDLPKGDNSGAYLYNSLNSGPFASLGSVENKETMITDGQYLIQYYTQDGVGNVTTNGNNPNVIYRYIMFDVRDVYTVTFDANGHGTDPAAQKVFDGDKITEPTITTPNGYALLGWTYTDGSETKTWDFDNNTVTGNITLTANWIANNFTAKYTDDGREVSVPFESLGAALGYASYPSDVDVTITQNVSLYEETNTPLSMVTGHKFTLQLKTVTNTTINVATGNDLAIESGTIKTSTADYALKITGGSVSLSGGTYTGTTAAIYNSAYINGNRVKILADGKAFFYGDQFDQMIYGDDGYGAAYYEIYNSNQIASRGQVLDIVEKTVEVKDALTMYAVSIDANGGDWDGNRPNTTQLVIEGGKAEAPDDPVLEGHSFDGWYYYLDPDHPEAGDAEWSFDNKVDKDYPLHAKYSKLKYTVSLPSNMEFADGSATPSDDGKYDYGSTIKIKVKDGYIVVGDVDYKYGTDATTYSLPTSLTPENGVYSFEVPEGDVVVTADVRAIQTITTAEIAALISAAKTYDGGYWANAKDGKYYNPYNTDPALSGTTMLIYVNDNVTPNETVYFPVTAKYVKSTTDDATGETTYTETKNVTEANAIEVEVLDENAYSLDAESVILSQLPNYTFAASDAYPFVPNTSKFYITDGVKINAQNLSITIHGSISKTYDGTTVVADFLTKNTPIITSGKIDGDDVSIASAKFDNAEVGWHEAGVTITLKGNDAANYYIEGTASGMINEISATLTAGLGAEIKVADFDGLSGLSLSSIKQGSKIVTGSGITLEQATNANIYNIKTAATTPTGDYTLTVQNENDKPVGEITLTVKDYTPTALNNTNWQSAISIPSTNTEATGYNVAVSVNGVSLTANNDGNFVVDTEGADVSVAYTLTDNADNTYHSVTKTVKIDKTAPDAPYIKVGEQTYTGGTTTGNATQIKLPENNAKVTVYATDNTGGSGIKEIIVGETSYSNEGEVAIRVSGDYSVRAVDEADNQTTSYYSITLATTYTVEYTNQKDGTTGSFTVFAGDKIPSDKLPKTTGYDAEQYKFLGWFAENSDDAWNFDNDVVSSSLKLTGKWQYKVTFDGNGHDLTSTGDFVEHGNTANSIAPSPGNSVSSCLYLGDNWFYKDADGELKEWGTLYNTSNVITAPITLYANWKKSEFRVTKGSNLSFTNSNEATATNVANTFKYQYGQTVKFKCPDNYRITEGPTVEATDRNVQNEQIPIPITTTKGDDGVYSFEVPCFNYPLAVINITATTKRECQLSLTNMKTEYEYGKIGGCKVSYTASAGAEVDITGNAGLSISYKRKLTDDENRVTYEDVDNIDNAAPGDYVKYFKYEDDNNIGETSAEFKIIKATPTVTPASDFTYDGTSYELVSVEPEGVEVLFSVNGGNYAEAIPSAKNAGPYQIKYKFDGTDNYNAIDETETTVTITTKAVYISIEGSISKIYDGTATLDIKGQAFIQDGELFTGDDVSITSATATFANAELLNTLQDVTITCQLSGQDADNYHIANSTASGTISDINSTLTAGLGANIKVADLDGLSGLSLSSIKQGSETVTESGITLTSATDDNNKTIYQLKTTEATLTGDYTLTVQNENKKQVGKITLTVKDYTPKGVFDDDWHKSITIPSTNTLAESDFIDDENIPVYKVSVNNLTANNDGNFVVNTEGADVSVTYTITDQNSGTNTYHSVTKTVNIDRTAPECPTMKYNSAIVQNNDVLPVGAEITLVANDDNDVNSGIDNASYTIDAEYKTSIASPVTLSEIQDYSWVLNVKDNAGNRSEDCPAISFTVINTIPTDKLKALISKNKQFDCNEFALAVATSQEYPNGVRLDGNDNSYLEYTDATTGDSFQIPVKTAYYNGNNTASHASDDDLTIKVTINGAIKMKKADENSYSVTTDYVAFDFEIEGCKITPYVITESAFMPPYSSMTTSSILTTEKTYDGSPTIAVKTDANGNPSVLTYKDGGPSCNAEGMDVSVIFARFIDANGNPISKVGEGYGAEVVFEVPEDYIFDNGTQSGNVKYTGSVVNGKIKNKEVALELVISNGGWSYGDYTYDENAAGYNTNFIQITKDGGNPLSDWEKVNVELYLEGTGYTPNGGSISIDNEDLAALGAGTYPAYVNVSMYNLLKSDAPAGTVYKESVKTNLVISPKSIDKTKLSIGFGSSAATTYSTTYDGTAQEPDVTVTYTDGTSTMTLPEYDLDIDYSNNINAGTATVTISPASDGDYTFEAVSQTFTIAPKPVAATVADCSKTYDGNTTLPDGITATLTQGDVLTADAGKVSVSIVNNSDDYPYAYPNSAVGTYTIPLLLELNGDKAGNYQLTNKITTDDGEVANAINVTGTINAKTLDAANFTLEFSAAVNKTKDYDGNVTIATTSISSPVTLISNDKNGIVSGKSINVNFSAKYQDATPGNGKTIVYTVTGIEGNNTNYEFDATKTTTSSNDGVINARITFNNNGHGTLEDAKATTYVTVGEKIPSSSVPTLSADGYSFGGWYTDADCTEGNKWDMTINTVGDNTTLYAKWNINSYTVTLPANMEFVSMEGVTVNTNNNGCKYVSVEYGTTVKFKAADKYVVTTEPTYNNTAIANDATIGAYSFSVPALTAGTVITIDGVVKKEITATVALDDWTYGQSPNDPVVTVDDNQISTGYTITYKKQGETDDTYTETTPSNAGDYTVRAVIAATDAHLSATATTDFSIEPATPTLNVFAHSYICGSGEWSAPDGFFAYRSDNSGTHLPGSWTLMSGTVTSTGSYKAQFTPTDKQNYTWAVSDEFKITFNNKTLPDGIALAEPDAIFTYDGTAKTPTIAGLGDLTAGETNDYVISYANNINAGTAASYTVTGKGCYAGSEKSDYFTIAKASLTVTANNHTITYGEDPANGGVQYDGFVNNETATVLGGKLAYDYSYTKYGNVGGNYTITPKGLTSANYEIEYQSGTLTVEPKEIGIAWSEVTEFPYDGDSHTLAATATELVNDDQCSLTVEGSGIVVGEYTAKVAALSNSNYKLPTDQSKLNKTFTITAASIEYTAADYTGTYDGQPHAISVSVSKPATGAKVLYSTSETGNFTATPITVTDVKDNKTVYFKISADNYTPTAVDSRKIELQPQSVANPTITFVNAESPTYDGSKQEPSVTVAIGDKTLTEGTDYTVEYTNNTNAGEATVTINSVANGNYTFTGTVSTTFDIEPADIDQSAVTELPKKSDTQLVYNGKAQPLVQAGTTTIGKFVYSLDGTNWQDDVPTGKDAEVYLVYYKVVDDNYNDYVPTDNNPIEVAIKRNVTLDVAISAWSYGSTPVTPVIKKDGEEISIDAVTLKYTDAKNNEVAISNTTPAGEYTLTVTYPATDTELEVTKTVTFSIAQATLTANDLTDSQKPTANKSGDNDLVYNSAPQALVIAPKELPEGYTIQYKLSTATEYGTEIPTAANAGKYTVNVHYVGDGNHKSFDGDDIPVNIGKASLTIAADAKTKVYGENDPALTYTVSGLKGTENAKSVLSGDLSREDGDAVGKYAINQGSLTANANYEIAYTAATFTIAPATLSIANLLDTQKPTANKSGDNGLVYNGTAQALVAAPAGALPDGYTIKYKLGDATSAEIPTSEEGFAANIPVGKNVGTYTVYYYYSGDANHVGFYGGAIEVKITPAALTVTADNITVSYGDPKPEYTATIVGLLADDTEATALGGTLAVNDEGYTNTTAVGEYTLTPSGYTADNYDITFVAGKLTVEANALDESKLEVVFDNATAEYTYNGEKQTPTLTLKYNGTVIPISEYNVEYSNNTYVGNEATVTITDNGGGNYTIPTKVVKFSIVPKEVSITWSNTNFTYDGSEHKPTATANNLIEGDVCEITVTGAQTNVGEDYIATATGLTGTASANYKLPVDNLTASFKIEEKGNISKDDLADTQKPTANRLTYNGTAQVLVNAPEGTLPEGYTIQYKLGSQDDDAWSDNIPEGTDAGTYVVNVRYVGDNNHTDFDGYDETVTINKAAVTVTAKDASKTFGGAEPEMFVVDVAGNIGDDAIRYNVARATGENVGTYAITPTGDVEQGNYKVTFVSGTFTINPKLVATPTIVLEYDKIPFDNTAKIPSVKVYDGETLITSNEYTVEYKDNINPGTATVIVTDNADGNYTVSRSTTLFTIQAVYTVTFHTAHGTAPAQKTGIVEGSKITAPTDGNMTATGYTFLNGWYTDGVDFADDTKWDFANGIVNRNLDLYAKWNIVTYTITLALDDGTLDPAIEDNKIAYTVETANFLLPTPNKEGSKFKGWTLTDESAATTNVTISPTTEPIDRTYKAVWEKIGYTITLNLNEGKLESSITNTITDVHFGDRIVVPEAKTPTRDGYYFDGWTYNNSALKADMTMPAANIELVAQWNIKRITVRFVDEDGTQLYNDYIAEYNTPFPEIATPADKNGRTFVKWEPSLPDNMPAVATTYKAVRRELHEKYIAFDMGEAKSGNVSAPATIIAEVDVDISDKLPTTVPEWEGHTFDGWKSSDGSQIVTNLPSVMPDHDVTFTAQWKTNTYYVTYVINDVENGEKQAVEYGSEIALREIVKEGYTFSGWSYNGSSISNMTMPASDITLVGTLTINSYPITFYIGTDLYSATEKNVEYGTPIQQLLPEVQAPTGKSFSGWKYNGKDIPADMTMPDGPIAITGTMTDNLYTITFYAEEDGDVVGTITGKYNEPVDASNIKPTSTKYAFVGWKTSVPETMPAENISIVADWTIKTFTIVFKNYDGTVLQTIENVEYGSVPAYTGETPEKTASAGIGHDFEGWVDDKGNVYGVNDVLPEAKNNATYTARFTDYDNEAPTITSVTVNGIEFVDTDDDVVECIESGKMTINATDDNSGVAKIEYTIHSANDEAVTKVYAEPVTLEPGYYVITIVATDNAGNSTEPMDVVAIVRREATLSTTEYTYTQLSGKDVVLEGLDLDGARVHSITIDGVEYTNIFKPETNALDHSLLDNVKIGSHTLHLYTDFGGEKHDTGIEFYLTVNGFVITTEQKDDIINAEGFCQGDISVVTLAFLDRDCPKYYKIKGIHDKYVPFEDWGSLGKDLGKLKFDVTDDFQPGTIEFEVSFTDDPTSNTESEFESFKVKINASNDRILKLFNDLIAIDNHDDLFTAFQWYKDGMKIEGADQQYYQSDGNIVGNYSAYVTTTSGETVKVCYVNFEDDGLSKSLKRSVNAYPNPARANEEITLELLNYDEAEYEGCVIKIVNAQGAIVATIDNCDRINTVSLPSGTYTGYVIRSGKNGDRVSFKLIVK